MWRWDAVVVGAGPAGSTSARRLAERGARVLLIERRAHPRYKACGGGIALRTERLLPFGIEPTVEASVTGIQMRYAGRAIVTHDSGAPFARMVMRDRFDEFLLVRALQAGADYREGTAVRRLDLTGGGATIVLDNGDEERAAIVIGADGANSVVGRSARLGVGLAECAAWELELRPPKTVSRAFASTCVLGMGYEPWGYAWVFPKLERISVGIVLPAERGPSLRAAANALLAELHLPETCIELAEGHKVRSRRGGEPIANDRAVLVGDAAGLADEFTQEGIFYAIRSGELAADATIDALGGAPLTAYETMVDRELMPELRAARLVGYMFYGALRHAGRAWLETMDRLPFLWRAFFAAQRGDSSYARELARAPMLERIAAHRLAAR